VLADHRLVLKSKGKTFLDGYISLAEGEKDPRNLMVAFAIARVILIEFDVSVHTEVSFRFNRVDQRSHRLRRLVNVQHPILLLPNHVPTSTKRQVRYKHGQSKDESAVRRPQ